MVDVVLLSVLVQAGRALVVVGLENASFNMGSCFSCPLPSGDAVLAILRMSEIYVDSVERLFYVVSVFVQQS